MFEFEILFAMLCYAMRSVLDDLHVLVLVLNVVISLMNDGMNVIVMGVVWSVECGWENNEEQRP